MTQPADIATSLDHPCQSCGACCATSRDWPRFSTEDDAALDLIPEKFINARQSGMKCDGDRCSGSDRDPGADPSREQAEGVDASLQQALDRLGGRRAS